jgi:pyruvate formate lyase activating enzyme
MACDGRRLQATVFNIMRFATHDGPGIRTAVFFKGCPLDCWWCHNPEGQKLQPEVMYSAGLCRLCMDCVSACPHHAIEPTADGLRTTEACQVCGECLPHCAAGARRIAGRRIGLADLIREIERDLVFFEESSGGVTLTGGEPLCQSHFSAALLRACRERGIHSVLETCGFARPAVFLRVALEADLVLFDLKAMHPDLHRHYTGVGNEQIHRNLEALLKYSRPLAVRIPVIPGVNDSDDEIERFARYLGQVRPPRVELLPYHNIGAGKYQRLGIEFRLPHTLRPDAEDLARFRQALEGAGLHVVIGG